MCVAAFISEINRIEKITFSEECRLFDQWKAGSLDARRKIIEAHIPWAVRIARNWRRHAIPLADLIQIGVLGLIAAVDAKTYDPRRRRLSKASYFQINSAIKEAVETQSTVVRIPRKRTRIVRLQFYSIDDGDLRLKDILASNGDPAHAMEDADEWRKLWRFVNELPCDLAITLRMHYAEHKTFRQIGEALNVTPQTAHKYHGRAIVRLRKRYAEGTNHVETENNGGTGSRSVQRGADEHNEPARTGQAVRHIARDGRRDPETLSQSRG